MPIDLPVVILIVAVAIIVGSSVARRAGEHADRVAGREPVAYTPRGGPLGAMVDLLDQSVAAYAVRRRLGLSTRTRAEKQADDARAVLVARAAEIRRLRSGAAPVRPKHLVVAGRAGEATRGRGSSTLPIELVAAGVGFVVVIGIVVAIAPRPTGGVLSATGAPSTAPAIPTPTPSPSPSQEPVRT
jgi:hypothetical protein